MSPLPGAKIRLMSGCPLGLSPVHTSVLTIGSDLFPLNMIKGQDKLDHNLAVNLSLTVLRSFTKLFPEESWVLSNRAKNS